MIRAILACDEDWGIGKNGDLPWPHNSADLRWFQKNTLNCTVVMGRKTWESLPRKPLPNRKNIIVTRNLDDSNLPSAPTLVHPEDLNLYCRTHPCPIWIIGGAQLVESCLPIIDEIWLSRIHGTYDCDTFLPRPLIEEQYALVDSGLDGEVYVDIWRKH